MKSQTNQDGGAGVYWLNRTIGGPNQKGGSISHTFTFTTNPNGTLLHTYSWGNNGWNGAWSMDAVNDVSAARQALSDPTYMNFVGGADFIPDVESAFMALRGVSSEQHYNLGLFNNCKSETDTLINLAVQIHYSTLP